MNTIPRIALAETNTDALESVKELEAQLKELPERGLHYANHQPAATDQLLTAYEVALSSPDSDVAKHAMSYLPQFVALCKVRAKELIAIALKTQSSRSGFTEASRYIAEAVDVAKNIDRIK